MQRLSNLWRRGWRRRQSIVIWDRIDALMDNNTTSRIQKIFSLTYLVHLLYDLAHLIPLLQAFISCMWFLALTRQAQRLIRTWFAVRKMVVWARVILTPSHLRSPWLREYRVKPIFLWTVFSSIQSESWRKLPDDDRVIPLATFSRHSSPYSSSLLCVFYRNIPWTILLLQTLATVIYMVRWSSRGRHDTAVESRHILIRS